ncbi:MAG: lipid-A-disaccharide synthase [Deltaproteobacteria bacterium]|nr:lipid-A-disaccharide synthase [Deltaproteobacteria bacterium]
MSARPFRIVISAGELSGDEHGAALISALKLLSPSAEVRGMGGRNLRAAGVDTVLDCEKSGSIMGFALVVRSIRKIFSALNTMKDLISSWRPDVLVLVDYPDFNLRLAKFAKRLGIKVFYFIPPKMWAWRSGRVELFKKYVDSVGLIFPFERDFFLAHGYQHATFVGHPFVETLRSAESRQELREEFCATHALDPRKQMLALLPGSRWFEIEKHLEPALKAVHILQNRRPDLQCVIAVAPSIDIAKLRSRISPDARVTIIPGQALDLMRVADAGLLKSGTSNLQAVFVGLPVVTFYIGSKFSEIFVRSFVKLKEFTLPNILRPHTVVELISHYVQPDMIVTALEPLLDGSPRGKVLQDDYKEIVESLRDYDENPAFAGTTQAYERAAKLVIQTATPAPR